MQQPLNNYDFLISKIDLFIRRYYTNKLLRGLIGWLAATVSAYLLATTTEYWAYLNTYLRTCIFFSYLLGIVLVFCWLVLPHILALLKLRKGLSHQQAAQL